MILSCVLRHDVQRSPVHTGHQRRCCCCCRILVSLYFAPFHLSTSMPPPHRLIRTLRYEISLASVHAMDFGLCEFYIAASTFCRQQPQLMTDTYTAPLNSDLYKTTSKHKTGRIGWQRRASCDTKWGLLGSCTRRTDQSAGVSIESQKGIVYGQQHFQNEKTDETKWRGGHGLTENNQNDRNLNCSLSLFAHKTTFDIIMILQNY